MLIAKIGDRSHKILNDDQLIPEKYIKMKEENPSSDYIATADGTWQLSYTKEQAYHLRRITYTARLDPLVNEYIVKTILNDSDDIAVLKQSIIETRKAIQQEYQYEPDNLFNTDGNSE